MKTLFVIFCFYSIYLKKYLSKSEVIVAKVIKLEEVSFNMIEFKFHADNELYHLFLEIDEEVYVNDRLNIFIQRNEEQKKVEDLKNITLVSGYVSGMEQTSKVIGSVAFYRTRLVFTGCLYFGETVWFAHPGSIYEDLILVENEDLPLGLSISKRKLFREFEFLPPVFNASNANAFKKISEFYQPSNNPESKNPKKKVPRYPDFYSFQVDEIRGFICEVDIMVSNGYFVENGNDTTLIVSRLAFFVKLANYVLRNVRIDYSQFYIALRIKQIILFDRTDFSDPFGPLEDASIDDLDRCSEWKHSQSCSVLCFIKSDLKSNSFGLSFDNFIEDHEKRSNSCDFQESTVYSQVNSNAAVFSCFIPTVTEDVSFYFQSSAFVNQMVYMFGIDKVYNLCNYTIKNPLNFPLKMEHLKSTFIDDCTLTLISELSILEKYCLILVTVECGNGQIDDEEECDCGEEEFCDAIDHCCTPSNGLVFSHPCSLRNGLGYSCSPSSSRKCDRNCAFKPDNLINASASVNVCKIQLLEECECEKTENQCHICCYLKNTCVSSVILASQSYKNVTLFKAQNTPCQFDLGKCKANGFCESDFEVSYLFLGFILTIIVSTISVLVCACVLFCDH